MTEKFSSAVALAAAGLSATLLVGTSVPASAAPRAVSKVVVNDAGDARSAADDLQRLTVRMTRTALVIRADFADADYDDRFRFWIDTSNKSRNYYGLIVPEGGFAPLRLVKGQGIGGPYGECDGFSASYLSGRTQSATVKISLRCLGNPKRARVATLATLGTGSATVRDSAPDRRAWTRPLTPAR